MNNEEKILNGIRAVLKGTVFGTRIAHDGHLRGEYSHEEALRRWNEDSRMIDERIENILNGKESLL